MLQKLFAQKEQFDEEYVLSERVADELIGADQMGEGAGKQTMGELRGRLTQRGEDETGAVRGGRGSGRLSGEEAGSWTWLNWT